MEIVSHLMALNQLLCCSAQEFWFYLFITAPQCETAAFMCGAEHSFIGMQWSLCFSPSSSLLIPEQRNWILFWWNNLGDNHTCMICWFFSVCANLVADSLINYRVGAYCMSWKWMYCHNIAPSASPLDQSLCLVFECSSCWMLRTIQVLLEMAQGCSQLPQHKI